MSDFKVYSDIARMMPSPAMPKPAAQPAQPGGGFGKLLKVESIGITAALVQVDAEDRLAVFAGRQVDEDNLAEPALANLLGSELAPGAGVSGLPCCATRANLITLPPQC